MRIIVSLGGAIIGAMLDGYSGFIFGGVLGLVAAALLDAQERIGELKGNQRRLELALQIGSRETERRIADMERVIADLHDAVSPASPSQGELEAPSIGRAEERPASDPTRTLDSAVSTPAEETEETVVATPGPGEATPSMSSADFHGAAPPQYRTPVSREPAYDDASEGDLASPGAVDRAVAVVRSLLFGGNTIVRVGILVLLVGVSLLLRWAAEHSLFPIELRMTLGGVVGLLLVAIGYRQRHARPGFGLTLQGGGVAAMYLVIFFSFRAYGLLPAGLAFGLLICVALSSGMLAILQDSLALVVIGQVGGFLAPVLASSGGGSHVALFSYYLLLNLLILGVAWFKSWRALNLIGFVFTFGIGSTWGALRYEPELFATTEPFLISFFLLYTALPVLFALRRPDEQRGWVDGSLVFGTPLAVLLLQHALVKNMPFGMAYSALALAGAYVGVSRVLYRRAPEVLRSLIEAFLAIGIGFATLAVPYGLDNHNLTGATWALEGAGLYWIGMRQKRWLSRLAGALLQVLAAVALLLRATAWSSPAGLPLANTRFLAGVLLCFAALFVARHAYAHRNELTDFEWRSLQALIISGLAFWFGVGLGEIDAHVPADWRPGSSLGLLGATALALELAGRKLLWTPSRYPAALLLPVMVLMLAIWELDLGVHPLGRGGVLGWPLCFCAAAMVLRRFVPEGPRVAEQLHALFAWLCAGFSALEALHLTTDFAALNSNWGAAAVGVVLALALFAIVVYSTRPVWPFIDHHEIYMGAGAGPIAGALLMWSLAANLGFTADQAPLPYLPVLNAIDIAQLGALAAIAAWYTALRKQSYVSIDAALLRMVPAALAGLAFLWWNGLLARSVHHFGDVAFTSAALWRSVALQVALSLSWALIGLCATVIASKRGQRQLWFVGAALLGVVVFKLFTVDLARLSTISKIGTFLVVGMLLVLVGYFAPVPPPREREPEVRAEGT